MKTITFLGKSVRGIYLNSFFVEQVTRRGFVSVFTLLHNGELVFSEVSSLQEAGTNWIPVDCTDEEMEEMSRQAGGVSPETVEKAVRAAGTYA